jgi:hypothetical protein
VSTEAIVKIEAGKALGRTAHDAEVLAEMEGGEYRAVFTVPNGRSVSQMRLFHKFCEVIAEGYPEPMDKDGVVAVLKIEAGHYDVRKLADGTYYRVPKSIAFNNMQAAEFTAFMDRAIDAACVKFGPDLTFGAFAEMQALIAPKPTLARQAVAA